MSQNHNSNEIYLNELIKSSRSDLLDCARLYCGNEFDAEDLVQETWLVAAQNVDKLLKSPNPHGWLMLVLKNRLRKFYARRASDLEHLRPLTEEIPNKAPLEASNESGIEDVLTPEELRMVSLREEGYTHEQIADVVGKNHDAVRKRFTRIRAKVTKFLGGET